MKKCSECKCDKPLQEFTKRSNQKDGLDYCCISCKKERQKRYYQDNKESIRQKVRQWEDKNPDRRRSNQIRATRKYKWGIIESQFDAMKDKQGRKCHGCLREFTKDLYACIDHCHTTGKIRGLLCRPCNLVIGNARDCVETIIRLGVYLEKSKLIDNDVQH